jgi:transposase InsO family protein
MPWKVTSVLDERQEFVRLARSGSVSVTELCQRFGISRDTGHRLLRRHAEQGMGALGDMSRRPHNSPRRAAAETEKRVLEIRDAHPAWGGRKIARRLHDLGVANVPAPSTVTEILRRHGRLDEAESVKHRPHQRFERSEPNALWQMDFKGHFALDRGRCHPLTVLDDHCRYSLGLRACANERSATVRGELTALFRRYGLPQAMLADNGQPWGAAGHKGAVTMLEVWLMQLGIAMLHGRPYHPQTQGKDERFHRTLNVELLQHNRFADHAACQTAFDTWRRVYNEQRPHEALNLDVPASRYRPSQRTFPETLSIPEYDQADTVRRVGPQGYFSFKAINWYMSEALIGQNVALRPSLSDGVWNVFFSRFHVGQIDLADMKTPRQTVRHVSEHLSDLSPV